MYPTSSSDARLIFGREKSRAGGQRRGVTEDAPIRFHYTVHSKTLGTPHLVCHIPAAAR